MQKQAIAVRVVSAGPLPEPVAYGEGLVMVSFTRAIVLGRGDADCFECCGCRRRALRRDPFLPLGKSLLARLALHLHCIQRRWKTTIGLGRTNRYGSTTPKRNMSRAT